MPTFKIAVIPGDGIGPEVVQEAVGALKALANRRQFTCEFFEFPWGSSYYFKHGKMMPNDGLDTLRAYDAIYFGAVGHPDIQDHITLNNLLLPIRRSFDQYVCLRPSILFPGVYSPLKGKAAGKIDMAIIRENTEGEYTNLGGFHYQGLPQEIAVQTALFTLQGCQRVIRYAFQLARRRKRKKVTSITKSNALGYGMVLWDKAFIQVAEEYPDISTESLLVDAACMEFIRQPESFDVVVASNLFGDILTDIAAIITGSMGLAASGNINPENQFPSMFEPVHGSAPDIVGKGVSNPLAAILSAAMMVRHLGEEEAAQHLERTVVDLLGQGDILTPDLGGTATTSQVGHAIIKALEA